MMTRRIAYFTVIAACAYAGGCVALVLTRV